jgi:predicted metal-dependent phosphotriesterase family hydrolase
MIKGKVQTVLGAVEPSELGLTLPHEHVIVDMTLGACSAHSLVNITESVRRAAAFPDAGLEPGEAGPGIAATWAKK